MTQLSDVTGAFNYEGLSCPQSWMMTLPLAAVTCASPACTVTSAESGRNEETDALPFVLFELVCHLLFAAPYIHTLGSW